MLQEFAIPELQKKSDLRDVFFQQDGAPPHCTKIVRELLNANFPDREDSLLEDVGSLEWILRSPDLTPCDFLLWGVY